LGNERKFDPVIIQFYLNIIIISNFFWIYFLNFSKRKCRQILVPAAAVKPEAISAIHFIKRKVFCDGIFYYSLNNCFEQF